MVVAVFEEVLFRGLIQNGVQALQLGVKYLTPQRYQKTLPVRALTSPALAVMISNTIFARTHLRAHPIIAASTFLFPIFPILHYTHDGLAAPLAAHVTTNLCMQIAFTYLR